MLLKQYYLACLAHASYLIADVESGDAAVVDPQRDVDGYLEDAGRHGLTIRNVILTHFHADFVSGHLELAGRTGAGIHLGRQAEADYPFRPMTDGDVIHLGAVRLRILETPGHTPESISVVVHDSSAGDGKPHAVLTGDTLFIGDVGRPDLMASIGITADELAGRLYDSLHDKLLALPDETLVYPAHGAGSMCGRNLSKETVSTIGQQRSVNYALKPMAREAFIALVTTDQPEAPAYFPYNAMLNRRQRDTLDVTLERALRPLPLEECLRLANAGCWLLDTREPAVWAAGHIPGSVNIGLSGKYATWAGTLLDHATPIVIIAEPGKEQEATTRLGRIGFDRVEGYLEHGIEAARVRPGLLERTERLDATSLAGLLSIGEPPLVVDVRGSGEHAAGRIEGSVNIPLNRLEASLDRLERGRRIVLQCQSGYRSSIAASLLARHGYSAVVDLEGGLSAWEKAGLPAGAEPPAEA